VLSATASTSTTTGALIVAYIREFIRTTIFKRHKFSDNANKLCIVGEPGLQEPQLWLILRLVG
jgi:hypothetical protein